jgi:hypothetical protein
MMQTSQINMIKSWGFHPAGDAGRVMAIKRRIKINR